MSRALRTKNDTLHAQITSTQLRIMSSVIAL